MRADKAAWWRPLGAPADSWAGNAEGLRVASVLKLNAFTPVQLNPAACTGATCLSIRKWSTHRHANLPENSSQHHNN